jgi:hypothetical protein
MSALVEHIGLPCDPDYTAQMALKIGFDPNGNQHNLALLDLTARFLHESGEQIPPELEIRRSQLEQRWLGGTLIRWLELPAHGEPDQKLGRLAMRLARMMEMADQPEQIVFVTAPMRNEISELHKFFDALTAVPLDTPVAAIVVGDSLSSDGSVTEAMLRHNANIARSFTRGIGPARRTALEHIQDPGTARTRLSSDKELYIITDTDSTVSPGLTDRYARVFADPQNTSRIIATGPVRYSFLWPDRPYLNDDGRVVNLSDPAGQYENYFTPRTVEFLERYVDPEDSQRIHIPDFESYRYFTNARSIGQLLASHGLRAADIVADQACRMMPGPNTCLRGNFLDQLAQLPEEYGYPLDNRHEQLYVSLMWQNKFPFSTAGLHLGNSPENTVLASERGIVGQENYQLRQHGDLPASQLTFKRLREIHGGTGLLPYKIDLAADGGFEVIDAAQTVAMAISNLRKLDRIA